jgi:diguanylate cyclase (GGDEF)-like protein/PAS domain S-box-containing protein
MFVADIDGACLYANSRLCELTGIPLERQLGYGWRESLHPDDVERVAAAWKVAVRDGADLSHGQRFVRSDSSVAWVEMTAVPIRREGRVVGWAGVCVDVTARRLSEGRYEDLVEHARDGFFEVDPLGVIVSANPAAEELTGYGRDELLGMNIVDLIVPEDVETAEASMARSLSGIDEARLSLAILAKDGRQVFLDITGRLVTENDVPLHWQAIARDVTDQHRLQDQLAHQAFHDSLTALPNRALLLDRLSNALARAGRADARVAVILLDLDNFKLVNDSLGHEMGDRLLRRVAQRLQLAVRDGDTVARLGGDEFAFVIDKLEDEREVVAVADRIAAELAEPFTTGASTHEVRASLGIVLANPGEAPDAILRNADTAMYSAKATNKGGFEIFDEGMRRRLLRELQLKHALAEAIRNEDLQVHYQPIVSLDTGCVLGVEALARWRHPDWGWIEPTEFVAIAETDGLITQLGQNVLWQAARQAARWHDRFPDALPLGVFVNVAPGELAKPDYAIMVQATLAELGLPPSRLGIEITERTFLDEQNEHTVANLAQLAAMGLHLSLDDFGTGYSSLASLKQFPFTEIKIDRYFVSVVETATDPAPISTAIVGLGSALGVTVIAEGIETDVQAEYLRRIGCHAAQGYLYARPQPAEDTTLHLEENLGIAAPTRATG